jgi:hypothetical protein
MTNEQALEFLQRHRPLPDESIITQDLLDRLKETIQCLEKHPDPRCVLPFLLALGTGTGCRLYEAVQSPIREYPAEVVVPALRRALESQNNGTRTWALHISGWYPDRSWASYYARSLESGDPFERYTAAAALATIVIPEDSPLVHRILKTENDEDVRMALQACLSIIGQQSDPDRPVQ